MYRQMGRQVYKEKLPCKLNSSFIFLFSIISVEPIVRNTRKINTNNTEQRYQ